MGEHLAIGIDIGGTKISVVAGSRRGRILSRRQIRTRILSKTSLCVKELVQSVQNILQEYPGRKKDFLGIGVCLPGPVDDSRGTVPYSPHLRGWKGLALRKILEAKTGLPVFMANDANAAAVAEKIFGKAKKASDFVYVTVSTGVGGGIFVGGRLLSGHSCVAGEIGHMTVEAAGEPWAMGEIGCLEAYASGTAIARYVKKQIKRGKGSRELRKLKKKGKLTAKHIGQLALQGDKAAKHAYKRAGFFLGIGLGNLLNVLNPEMIIIGGGVLKSSPAVFWKSMLSSCKKHSWREAYRAVKIERTSLGDHVGNLGAMALVYLHDASK